MKKLVLTITASLLLIIGAKAQADLSFDSTWVPNALGTLQDARGWTSFNTASLLGMPQTVFRVTNSPAFGVAAAKVVTSKTVTGVSVPNPFRPNHNFDTVGLMCLGTINLLAASPLTFGQPLGINRPAFLSFSSKDSSVVGDSAFVLAYLTKWNAVTNKRDTIASGKWGENGISSTWASHRITMTYYSTTIVPDSQQIFVSSSIYMRPGAKYGSAYYVDQFCWDCTAGINENDIENSVSVFPNPASTEINFTSSAEASYVEIADITGRKLGIYQMQNNNAKIHTESFTPGFYMYTIMNDKKVPIKRGKFEVVR